MKKRLEAFFKSPWYPLTIALYPPLALLAYNVPEVNAAAGLRSVLLSLLGAGLMVVLLRLIYRDWHAAAFAAAILIALFFTYGHVYDTLSEKWTISHLTAIMLGLWSVLAVLGLVWAWRGRIRIRGVALIVNIVSLGLVLYSVGTIIAWSIPKSTPVSAPVDDYAPVQELVVPEDQSPPDIYYIIIDSYGRSDLLKRSFDVDNSAFLQQLEELGFYVADCAQSNYNRTDVSMASSLNLDYLQNLDDDYQPGSTTRRTLWDSVIHSTVRANLENIGYRTVAFASGFAWSEFKDADVYITPSLLSSEMTGFETLLIRTTPARHFEDLGWINLDWIDGERYRQRTELIFNSMDDLSTMPGPKFVFIHILPPHPPFIYAPDGTPTDPAPFLDENRRYTYDSYTEGYRNQVKYISGQVLTAVETLLEGSSTPPIIILQGDHAPWLQTGSGKFLILNAYYLPGHNDLLYPTISPVNTFRVIFDTYFGAQYDLLPDISYYSPIPNIYEFEEFPNHCVEH
jgi:hypothetical protein